jgi:hypothetical protein
VSQTHLRKRKVAPRKSGWGSHLLTVVVVLAIVLIVGGRVLPRFQKTGRESSLGKVLETRIVIVSTGESSVGSYAYYRIEAHVTFDMNGEKQDRWISASDDNSNRAELELQILDRPGTCVVSWSPRHPENAHCSLK